MTPQMIRQLQDMRAEESFQRGTNQVVQLVIGKLHEQFIAGTSSDPVRVTVKDHPDYTNAETVGRVVKFFKAHGWKCHFNETNRFYELALPSAKDDK